MKTTSMVSGCGVWAARAARAESMAKATGHTGDQLVTVRDAKSAGEARNGASGPAEPDGDGSPVVHLRGHQVADRVPRRHGEHGGILDRAQAIDEPGPLAGLEHRV